MESSLGPASGLTLSVLQWFKAAGFQDVKIKRIGPSWYRGVRRHGLIMGCSVTGVKAQVLSSALRVTHDPSPDRPAHGYLRAMHASLPGRHSGRGECQPGTPSVTALSKVAVAARLHARCCLCLGTVCYAIQIAWLYAEPWCSQDGESPLQMEPKREQLETRSNPLAFLARLLLGTLAGSYYFLLPVYMWLKNLVWPRSMPGF